MVYVTFVSILSVILVSKQCVDNPTCTHSHTKEQHYIYNTHILSCNAKCQNLTHAIQAVIIHS